MKHRTTVTSLVEEYEEHVREVGPWTLQIIAYKLDTKYVCIINNLDPGATVCRMSARTRDSALRDALQMANSYLSQTVMHDIAKKVAKPTELHKIQLCEDGQDRVFMVGDFLVLPLQERMAYILSGNLVYYAADGSTIQSGDAMRLLKQASSKN